MRNKYKDIESNEDRNNKIQSKQFLGIKNFEQKHFKCQKNFRIKNNLSINKFQCAIKIKIKFQT